MIKSRFSGTWWWIMLLCLFLFLSINNFKSLIFTNQDYVQHFLREGLIYGEVNSREEVALKILNISETNVKVENRKFYVVETSDRLVLLESDEKSEDLEYILKNKNNLNTGEYYLAVGLVPEEEVKRSGYKRKKTVYNITPEFLAAISGDLKSNSEVGLMSEKNKSLVSHEYVSLHRYEKSLVAKKWLSIIFIILSLLVARNIYKRMQKNMKEYIELKELYPDLGDFSIIKENADFKDEDLKFLVYNGALITYYKEFSITKLSDLKKIEILEVETKSRGIQISSYSIGVIYKDGKLERWLIKKYKKETFTRLQKFKEYIQNNYPNIEVIISKK